MAGTASCSFALNTPEHIRDACLAYAVKLGFKPSENGLSIFQKNSKSLNFKDS